MTQQIRRLLGEQIHDPNSPAEAANGLERAAAQHAARNTCVTQALAKVRVLRVAHKVRLIVCTVKALHSAQREASVALTRPPRTRLRRARDAQLLENRRRVVGHDARVAVLALHTVQTFA